MTPGQLRSLVSRYIGARLDEWEKALDACLLHDQVDGEWPARPLARTQPTVEDSMAALNHRLGVERLAHEFMQRYKVTMEPSSSASRMLHHQLVKAEKVIQATIKEWAQGECRPHDGEPMAGPTEALKADRQTSATTYDAHRRGCPTRFWGIVAETQGQRDGYVDVARSHTKKGRGCLRHQSESSRGNEAGD